MQNRALDEYASVSNLPHPPLQASPSRKDRNRSGRVLPSSASTVSSSTEFDTPPVSCFFLVARAVGKPLAGKLRVQLHHSARVLLRHRGQLQDVDFDTPIEVPCENVFLYHTNEAQLDHENVGLLGSDLLVPMPMHTQLLHPKVPLKTDSDTRSGLNSFPSFTFFHISHFLLHIIYSLCLRHLRIFL